MNFTNLHYRTIGLAGVFQAALLVKQLATTGKVTEPFFQASIESLFKIEAVDAFDVYNGKENLSMGLNELIRLFSDAKAPKDSEIPRYVLSMLHLERKLSKEPQMLKNIESGIKRAKQQAQHFSSTHENVMANLAGLYTDTLSTFKFRIYIPGQAIYLNQTQQMHKIRALLLAGIRSAVLWRQLGGRRWQLLISRLSIIKAAKDCLSESKKIPSLEI